MAVPLEQRLAFALEHHRARRFVDAERACRGVLQRDPRHADALHLLGRVLHASGRTEAALESSARARDVHDKLGATLARHALTFVGFDGLDPAVTATYRADVPGDCSSATDLAAWDAFEDRHPEAFPQMLRFWCTAPTP